ncbi:MAG TPA: LacI family DNA-binding transcriptional regulator [Aggregatilinea sp.]|jgi:DNA-binding LacI/PurR family transcriptional regulator|uniref:LacI family DNA-binding transcriptional regulator n=1 Tax=Aggregatilinea sp. TaxID=2806333 RepID=UPI002C81833C|nr:LacI family DNA-binding transcriptional regulator [Aggregatilinea sp.]HML23877.1 LacI family DNA-binding transcriptional regulator [Aggregatilinea sp.]
MNQPRPKNDYRRVTQKDVAARAGVSPSVVSFVLNNGPRSVSEDTRQRVLDAIEELGYRPDKQRQMVMREKWGSTELIEFGIVLGGGLEMLESAFYGAVLAGMFDEAYEAGKRVRFTQFWDRLKDPVLFNELIHPEEVSGLIILAANQGLKSDADRTLLERIVERIDNVVFAEDAHDRFPSATTDLQSAANKAMSHLIALGHQRIAYIGTEDARLTGYLVALLEAGLPHDPNLVFPVRVINDAQAGFNRAGKAVALSPAPTAIFTANDELACGVIRYLHENGLRVPEDIAIVSIDDIAMASYLVPSLTTIRLPKRELGRQAVRMLIDRDAHAGQTPVSVVLPTELVIRESCGYYAKG